MGAQSDAETFREAATTISLALEPEAPCRASDAGMQFFLSKYEMTQGQWERVTGSKTTLPTTDTEVRHRLQPHRWERVYPGKTVSSDPDYILGLVLPHRSCSAGL